MKASQIIDLDLYINTIKVKEFSLDNLSNLVLLKKELTNKKDDIQALQKAVLEKYEVPNINGRYEFLTHPQAADITRDLEEISKIEHTISPSNFITLEQLQKGLTDEHTLEVVIILQEGLVKK